jgi:hypothetical protein
MAVTRARRMARRALVATTLATLPAPGAAVAADESDERSRAVDVTGYLRDPAGAPIANVFVFAAEDGTDRMAAFAVSDAGGRIVLKLPRRRHNFGLSSARYGVASITYGGPATFVMEVKPLPAAPPSDGAQRTLPLALAGARVIRGRVTDQTSTPLVAVRVEAVRADLTTAAVAFTDPRGQFALGLVGGRFQLRTVAPGLRVAKAARRDDRFEIVMEVDAQTEQVSVVEGHVLRFRLDRSLDPEIFPPAPVRAWLCFSYGIKVRSRAPTDVERKGIKKYWYLDVLRNPPPNPAKIAQWDAGSCSPDVDAVLNARSPYTSAEYNRPFIERLGGGALPSAVFGQ